MANAHSLLREHRSQGVLLEGVGNAIFLQQPKEIGRVLVDDNVLAGDVNAESIRGEVFAVLVVSNQLPLGNGAMLGSSHTLPRSVLSNMETFFSVASAKLISMTS